MVDTDDLILTLAADKAGLPLSPPALRAVAWLGTVFVILGGLVFLRGLRPDLGLALASPGFILEWVASITTGILASFAAFHLAQPDRSSGWRWLPVPGLVIWIGTFLYGIHRDLAAFGPDCLHIGASLPCATFITLTTVPLGAVLFYLLRYAGPIRPVETVFFATLSIAAFTSATQSLAHNITTSLMVLVWHVGTVAALLIPTAFLGPILLRAMIRWSSKTLSIR